MKKVIKTITVIIIIATIIFGILSGFINKVMAVTNEIERIDESKYPGFKILLQELQTKYPKWKFKIKYTGLDWNEVIDNEYADHSKNSRSNLVQATTNYKGAWICADCDYENGLWKCASKEAIRYMMDPRNSLNSDDIFQFEELTYNGHDVNAINTAVKGTFLEGHSQEIVNASKTTGINPYFIMARVIQEQGLPNGTVLVTGEKGVYNPFNIGATGDSDEEVISSGVEYAKSQGWTTLEKGLVRRN